MKKEHPFFNFAKIPQYASYLRASTVTFCSLLILLLTEYSLAEGRLAVQHEWEKLLVQHSSKAIHDTIYLKEAGLLVDKFLKDPELKSKLSAYKNIAWSQNQYQFYRAKYFSFLANNAIKIHQEGYAIYYLQKHEEELSKLKPYVNSLNEPRMLLAIYGSNVRSNIEKRLSIFQKTYPFLRSLPGLLSHEKVPANTCMNAVTILNHAAQIYATKNDSSKVLEFNSLAEKILSVAKRTSQLDEQRMRQCRLMLCMIQQAKAKVLKNPDEEKKALSTAQHLLQTAKATTPYAWERAFERTLYLKLIDFHISQNQIDSSRQYFNLLNKHINSHDKNQLGDDTKSLLYSGKISAVSGEYKAAYDTLFKAYTKNDSIIATQISDIHNNMYSNLLVEKQREQLLIAEVQKGKKSFIIFAVSTILVAVVAFFILFLRFKERKMQQQIENLNHTTQIHIAELESKANMIQRKLSMELHDGIVGNLTHICNYIAYELLDEKDAAKRERLTKLGEVARETYASARLTSHEWYTHGTKEEFDAFVHSITKIVDQALPSDKYQKHVEIDDLSIENISPSKRIHLLRIIQEAMTNIIKHAKASKIKLFIFQEDHFLTLQIIDNGKGFNQSTQEKKESVGLKSLRSRVLEMNGSLDIKTSGNGTEILCCIPSMDSVGFTAKN
jgi:signal transduction histidine kinase